MTTAIKWMIEHAAEHTDPRTGEVCVTTLAEDCAVTLYDRAAEESEFELAFDVSELLEKR